MNLLKKLFGRTDGVKKRAALLLVATITSNAFNFLYNAFLGRNVSLEDFALITLIGGILSITDIPVGALGKAVVFKSAYHFGKYNKPATAFWQYLRKKVVFVSILLSVLWLISSVAITHFFHIHTIWPVLLVTPIWMTTLLSSVDGGYLSGNLRFGYLSLVAVIESVIKFAIAMTLVKLGYDDLAYLSIIFSSFISFIFVVTAASRIKKPRVLPKKTLASFPFKFYFSSAMTKISTVMYLSMDVILAKHFLSPDQAGQYALLSLSGKMVYFAGSLFAQFILPVVSHKEGSGKNSKKVFYQLLLASFVTSFTAFLAVGALGQYTMPILFGSKANAILPLLPLYALAMVAFTIATNIVSFHQIKGKHILPVVSFILAITEILGIMNFHSSLQSISTVMVVMGFVSLLVIGILNILESFYKTLLVNTRDFFGAFMPYEKQRATSGLRILIFNWRDTRHMWSGGAEVYVHELAKRWAMNGNAVTIFCGNDRKSKRNETVEGVSIVRRGGFYTVYLWAGLYYLLRFRRNFDIIVDSENGIPFFSPLFSTTPVILLIHHVHQEVFIEQMKFPLSYIGRFIEGKLMPFIYRNKTVITVSKSSKNEIIKTGIAKENDILIVNPGIDVPENKYKKTPFPSLIYLGRLKPYKNIDIAIKAFKKIYQHTSTARLWIVGDGESAGNLKELVLKLNINEAVTFFGKVTEKKKIQFLSQSWIALQPSEVEGWGITVLEANACKTPVIASNVNGLRDSIVNGRTGALVPVRNVQAMAAQTNLLISDQAKRKIVSQSAYSWARTFSWDKSSTNFYSALTAEIANQKPSFSLRRATYLLNRVTSLF